MPSFLITGSEGMLGSEFRSLARTALPGQRFSAFSHSELDIANPLQIQKRIDEVRPDILINCAAYREVDKAELEPEQAWKANAEGPRLLAEACRKQGVKLVHFSTHGVFGGEKEGPYVESDRPQPLNQYARTKWEGDRQVLQILPASQSLVLRISWPYARRVNNFIRAILARARSHSEVKIVADQIGIPNPARLLAMKTLEIAAEASGMLHLSCVGHCSRYELMTFLFDRLGLSCRALPVKAEEFPAPAPRPKNMAIATERKDWADRLAMPDWKVALVDFLAAEGFAEDGAG